ncbi:hypothetical protein [Methylomonas sp.]|uniref:hypothetical protein n=1 Tax=Methylomonas sp. TaxID=418 RepID=UPI0025DC5D15|nr:hypothetical protein [Methylomonas sp.]
MMGCRKPQLFLCLGVNLRVGYEPCLPARDGRIIELIYTTESLRALGNGLLQAVDVDTLTVCAPWNNWTARSTLEQA